MLIDKTTYLTKEQYKLFYKFLWVDQIDRHRSLYLNILLVKEIEVISRSYPESNGLRIVSVSLNILIREIVIDRQFHMQHLSEER